MLGVPKSWVYEQSRLGRIPTVTLGRYRRYRLEAIEAWIRQIEGAPTDRSGAPEKSGPESDQPEPGVDGMPASVSGHVKLAKRKHGDQWYVKYRLPSGRQVEKRLGPAWSGRGPRPPGYHTRKSAEAQLAAILTDARRGALPDPGARSGRAFADAVAEWLRYTEHERGRKRSTLRDYRNAANGQLLPEFGAETPLEEITARRIEAYRGPAFDRIRGFASYRPEVDGPDARHLQGGPGIWAGSRRTRPRWLSASGSAALGSSTC